MSLIDLKALNNDDLKKRLTKQIKVENWTDKYSKYGYPKLIHKNLHRDATCTEKQETREALIKYQDEFTKRVKPALKALKEDQKKDMQEGILLEGLKELLDSNAKNILSQTKQMNETWATMASLPKVEDSNTNT